MNNINNVSMYNNYSSSIPENVVIEMKQLYEHYVRNPIIQQNDVLINKIRIKSHQISNGANNDYIVPEFGGSLRINSPNTILIVIEDILVQRQNAINSENKKMRTILSLKEEHEMILNRTRNELEHKNKDIKKIKNELNKYIMRQNEFEEKQLYKNKREHDGLLIDIERLKKENERIAQEFLHGANVWNSEKAIMAAERAQIENDCNYIAHNLEQLILERQQFEEEADRFNVLYHDIINKLHSKGIKVEVEYANNLIMENNKRRKIKLYQTATPKCENIENIEEEKTEKKQKKILKNKQKIMPKQENIINNFEPNINININGKNQSIEDEADAYIPFDEPDEFNLLDQEYKKSAMQFVSENDNFMTSDLLKLKDGDVNLMAQEVLSQELQRKQEKLPDLQGWIEKKSPTFARGWQKRWVIVREYNIFYGKNKTDIKDTKNEAERKKFLNAIPLLVVQYIVATDHSRSGRKFEIVARDPRTGDRRHYQWKAATREECDKWVRGLTQHKKLLAARLQFLSQTGQNTNV